MDKRVNLIWLLICLPAILFSQAQDSSNQSFPNTFYYKRIFVGMNFGVSFPISPFYGTNENFNNSAFAQRGIVFNYFDFGYRIENTLGVTGYLFNTNNPIDKSAVLNKLNSINDTSYTNSNVGDYQLRGLMLGLLISKYGNLYDLDLKFMAGTAKFSIPQMSFNYSHDGLPEIKEITFSSTNEQAFGVGLGIGFRIHINQYIDFTTNANYLIFQNSFSRTIDDQSTIKEVDFKLTHETFNLSFGIAYRILNDKSLINEK